MSAFWFSLWWIFLAELGDKTQLVAMSLAARFNMFVVLSGILVATLVVHVLSVAIGGCAGCFLPYNWIGYFAGIAFIGFGFWTLRGDCLDGDESCKCRVSHPFWLVAITFFLAELGDKTMLSTVALASDKQNPIVPVWLGSSLGMVVSDGLAIIVGQILGKKLPERIIKIGAGVIFLGFGSIKIAQVVTKLPPYAWGMGAVIISLFVYLYIRASRRVEEPIELVHKEEEPLAEPIGKH